MIPDYLVVGAGLFGAVFAYEARRAGKSVHVIDKRDHVGGNCYTKKIKGVTVHAYGPHVFHTDDEQVWDYVNQFVKLKPFVNRPKTFCDGKFYSFPINLMTLNQIWDVRTPKEAREKLSKVSRLYEHGAKNFEEWLLSKIGQELYEVFYKNYTEKLWGVPPTELPVDFAKRVPIRFDFNDSYYDDTYQGVPLDGYAGLFDGLLEGIQVDLDTKYCRQRGGLVVYTGRIDEYFDYKFGKLDYRSIRFVEDTYIVEDYQGNPVINYPEKKYSFVRSTEHKHFLNETSSFTIVTKEYPDRHGVPCYPVRNKDNTDKLSRYQELATKDEQVIFGGRLGTFRYLDMDDTIVEALRCTKENVYI